MRGKNQDKILDEYSISTNSVFSKDCNKDSRIQ